MTYRNLPGSAMTIIAVLSREKPDSMNTVEFAQVDGDPGVHIICGRVWEMLLLEGYAIVGSWTVSVKDEFELSK